MPVRRRRPPPTCWSKPCTSSRDSPAEVREISSDKRVRRDVSYPAQRTLVELDGQFGHRDAEDRWADLDRDLAAAVRASITIRLGWAHVLSPCRVAEALAVVSGSSRVVGPTHALWGWMFPHRPCGSGVTTWLSRFE